MPLLGISMEESLKLLQLLAEMTSKLDGSTEVKEPTHRGQFNFTFRRNVEELLSATTFCHGMLSPRKFAEILARMPINVA